MHLWLYHWRYKDGLSCTLGAHWPTGNPNQSAPASVRYTVSKIKVVSSGFHNTHLHTCITEYAYMHIQRHTLTWICTCHIPHMHGNTCSKFGSTFRQPGSFGDEFCPDGWGISYKWMMWLEDSWLNMLFASRWKMGCHGWPRKEFIVSALKEDVQMTCGRKLLEHAVFGLMSALWRARYKLQANFSIVSDLLHSDIKSMQVVGYKQISDYFWRK